VHAYLQPGSQLYSYTTEGQWEDDHRLLRKRSHHHRTATQRARAAALHSMSKLVDRALMRSLSQGLVHPKMPPARKHKTATSSDITTRRLNPANIRHRLLPTTKKLRWATSLQDASIQPQARAAARPKHSQRPVRRVTAPLTAKHRAPQPLTVRLGQGGRLQLPLHQHLSATHVPEARNARRLVA